MAHTGAAAQRWLLARPAQGDSAAPARARARARGGGAARRDPARLVRHARPAEEGRGEVAHVLLDLQRVHLRGQATADTLTLYPMQATADEHRLATRACTCAGSRCVS